METKAYRWTLNGKIVSLDGRPVFIVAEECLVMDLEKGLHMLNGGKK